MSAQRERVPDSSDAPDSAGAATPLGAPPANNGRHAGATEAGAPEPANAAGVVVLPAPQSAPQPKSPSAARAPAPSQAGGVHVAPNLHELITAAPLATPEDMQTAKERRDLNEVVHGVLIIGLIISTALMLAGIGLALFYQRDLPTVVPDIGDVVGRVLAVRPSGFLALGLLVLIATPILRVVGSIGAFVYERDWRFAGVTALVLVVLIVSLLLGRG